MYIRTDPCKWLTKADEVDVFVRAVALAGRKRVERLEERCLALAILADQHIEAGLRRQSDLRMTAEIRAAQVVDNHCLV